MKRSCTCPRTAQEAVCTRLCLAARFQFQLCHKPAAVEAIRGASHEHHAALLIREQTPQFSAAGALHNASARGLLAILKRDNTWNRRRTQLFQQTRCEGKERRGDSPSHQLAAPGGEFLVFRGRGLPLVLEKPKELDSMILRGPFQVGIF